MDAFNDPLEALSHFSQGVYDIALIDIKMPKMNGFELCKRMHRIDPDVHYCFITAFEIHASEFRMVFPTTNVTGFIKKPFPADDLLEYLETKLSYDIVH